MHSNEQWRELARWHREFQQRDQWAWFRSVVFIDRWNRAGWFYECLNTLGGMDMARGKTNGKSASPKRENQWTVFVDIPLGSVGWGEIESAFGRTDDIHDTFQGLLESGYRVSFTFNPANDAATCSVTCKDEESPNAGKTFTSFGANWVQALQVAMYKHYVIAEQVWGDKGKQSDTPRFG